MGVCKIASFLSSLRIFRKPNRGSKENTIHDRVSAAICDVTDTKHTLIFERWQAQHAPCLRTSKVCRFCSGVSFRGRFCWLVGISIPFSAEKICQWLPLFSCTVSPSLVLGVNSRGGECFQSSLPLFSSNREPSEPKNCDTGDDGPNSFSRSMYVRYGRPLLGANVIFPECASMLRSLKSTFSVFHGG
jgi:hypothetical protein